MERITKLEPHQVFVYGANRSGIHGLGAAAQAVKWGAVWGKGEGLYGQTYAIPTKDFNVGRTLDIEEIRKHVDKFIEFTKTRPDLEFLVTPIGTGLARIPAKDIAPLFSAAKDLPNIKLPKEFL